jgi:hypothetical protein
MPKSAWIFPALASFSSRPPQLEDIPMLAAISEVQVELHRADKRRWPATGGQMSVSGKDRSRQSEEKTCLLSAAARFSDQLVSDIIRRD